MLLVAVGDDVAVVDASATASRSTCRRTSTRPAASRASPSTARRPTVLPGARQMLVDLARVILSAEAVGVARECTEMAAAYAKERLQFGRPIAHVPGREAPLRQHGRRHRAGDGGGVGRRPAAADRRRPAHATRLRWPRRWRRPAADLCANLNTQVHGGIAHHLGARRPPLSCAGRRRCSRLSRRRRGRGRRSPSSPGAASYAGKAVELPPEAEADPRRGAGVRRAHQGPRRADAAARRAHRDRLRDAALARSPTGARPAPSSSW